MAVGLLLLTGAVPAYAVPMRLEVLYEFADWRFEPFGLTGPPARLR
jgi:hypothetical protein